MVLQFKLKKEFLFARDLSLESSVDSYLCFQLALLHSMSYFFFLYCSPSSSLCTVFDSNMNEVSDEILMCFFVKALTSIIRTGLRIFVELIDLVNSIIISNDLTQMLNFPTRIIGCDSCSPALLDSFISSEAIICLKCILKELKPKLF